MVKKLTKQEIKAWYMGEVIELIDSLNDTGIPSLFLAEEFAEIDQLKAALLKRLGAVDRKHNHLAHHKIDNRLSNPTY